MATVEISGIKRAVNIACILSEDRSAEDCIGDWVLVHVGFAMSRIDENEAQQTLQLLDELNDLQGELESLDHSVPSR